MLRKRKEARRRNLQFHIPTAIPLAPQLRLVETDSSYISLQDVYDDYSTSQKQSREASIMTYYDKMRQLQDPTIPRVSSHGSCRGQIRNDLLTKQNDPRYVQLRMEVLESIQAKMCPETVLTNVSLICLKSPPDRTADRPTVHDQDARVVREPVDHAQAVRYPDRRAVVPHLLVLREQQDA